MKILSTGPGGKKHGSKKQKLPMWKARFVQDRTEHKAHVPEMRIRRVCAWNTSRLAFDGSGKTERGKYVQDGKERCHGSICTSSSGKPYNCGLNTSYHTGARYFIREILKSVPETGRLSRETKVPSAARRSTSTRSALRDLKAAVSALVP